MTNHFDSTRKIILSRINQYTSNYHPKDLEDLVAYQMRSYAIVFNDHHSGSTYNFSSFDIDYITNMIINLIRPRK